ncbi:hypothetical protein GW17_00008951, partial [Ensete ventricosum]
MHRYSCQLRYALRFFQWPDKPEPKWPWDVPAATGLAALEAEVAAQAQGLHGACACGCCWWGRGLLRRRVAREAYGEVEVEIEAAVPVSATAVAGGVLSHARLFLIEGGDRPVNLGVEASAEELPLAVRVPVVLDLVVGPSRQSPCY